jgi:ADP-heptose:LPS heptosyltransferase
MAAAGRARVRVRATDPKKILVLHELLLGDTLMLAPLLAALRNRYPAAQLFVSSPPAYANLFSGKPYGVHVLPFSERLADPLEALAAAADCDLALLPGDNRHAIAAMAIGAKWIVGFAEGTRTLGAGAVDEFVEFPATPMALADMFALLARPESVERQCYRFGDWPSPQYSPFEVPRRDYAVLHVGAGSPLRLWAPDNWRTVAKALEGKGLQVVWSAGPDEVRLVNEIDPESRYESFAGRLDLPQLWHLLAEARIAVTLDTGIAHMAKLTGTPVAALFGPGSSLLFGRGRFWEGSPFVEVTASLFACRDQRHLFKREIGWVRRCNRTLSECPEARCMEVIVPEQVLAALQVQ